MTTFHYRALQTDGTVVEGDLQANVPQEAYRKMEYCGLLPIKLSAPTSGETPPKASATADSAAESVATGPS